MLSVGFDPGFGNVKAAVVNGSRRMAVVPSVVGVGETDLGLLGDFSVPGVRRRSHALPDVVEFDGLRYLAGENVADYGRPVERMDFLRLNGGPELRTLFYAVMHRLLGPGEHGPLGVVVGLPVEIMLDRERALATRRELRKWMVGEHRFRVNAEDVVLRIEQVDVLAQPAGAFFAWALTDDGRWTRPLGELKHPIAVCDIGFNTLDLFTLRRGQVIARFTAGDTMGMRRAAEHIIRVARQRYGVALSLHEADALLRARRPELATSGGVVDMRRAVHQALDMAAADVVAFIERQWGNAAQFRHVLFTGGGSEMLRDALIVQYPHGVVLQDAVTANALGLARYAAQVWSRER